MGITDWILRRRKPGLIVIDEHFNVIAAEPCALDLLEQRLGTPVRPGERLPAALQSPLKQCIGAAERGARGTAAVAGLLLHLVGLNGEDGAYYGLLVELEAERD